jgi:SAM-dependent methyltransferase
VDENSRTPESLPFVDEIIQKSETQENNVFNTYSPLWASLFAERNNLSEEYFANFLRNSQSSGIAGKSKNPQLLFEFYAKIIGEDILDAHPMSPVGNPETDDFNGRPASVTYLENLSTLSLLKKSLSINDNIDVVEIGAGYGGFASFLLQTGKVNSYTIIDLPENLINSAYYLTQNFPEIPVRICSGETGPGINLVLPGHINVLANIRFDLAINMDSFGEMVAATAKAYVAFIHNNLREGGVFFSKNGHRRGRASGVQKVSEYGYQKFGLRSLSPPINASSVYDDFSHIVLLEKGAAPMTNQQISGLDTLSDIFAIGLHCEMEMLSERLAEQSLGTADIDFLDWAEAYFSDNTLPYEGQYQRCANFMLGMRQAVSGRNGNALLQSYLRDGRSFAAQAYCYLILSKGNFANISIAEGHWNYFLAEVKSLGSLPGPARAVAFRIRLDNLRKKVDRNWRPSFLRRMKDIAFNLRELKFEKER